MAKDKRTQSEIDGVQYRRAKLWQIIANAFNAFIGMSVYTLIGMANYSASIGFGISTAVIGIILTCTRILDGVTDPMLAFLYDKVNTRFGKIRILMLFGFIIEAIGLMAMFVWLPGKGLGIVGFTLTYVVYVIGYTIINMTAQTIAPLLTNDPKQRPILGVWNTAFNYIVPMALSIVLNSVMLPLFGGEYNLEFLATACMVCLGVSFFGLIVVCIGVTPVDKPENFEGLTAKKEPLKLKDMVEVLKNNRPLQCYIVSAASDKIAQQTAAQSIITTLLNGILIGNMMLATILTVIGMLPSILFAVVGAKQAGKYGAKETIVRWTKISTVFAVIMFIFFVVIEPSEIANMGTVTIIYVILTLCLNGAKMCITTANTSFMSDLVDYELDRSGRYIPAVVSGTYSLLDKIISSGGAAIAAGAVALVGYVNTVPQPGDPATPAIFWLTMAIVYGLPILGWICTLIAMKFCDLDRAEMIEVQKRIAAKKEALNKEQ
ncbi:MAG: MFS transporter [Agathobacter sp.]|nr:MFS transporter [Agathobacter sp.]